MNVDAKNIVLTTVTSGNGVDDAIPRLSYPLRRPLPSSYSFACAGWLKSYLMGAAKALQQLEMHKDAKMIGSSAGSLAALGLCLDCDFDAMKQWIIAELVPEVKSTLWNAFRIRKYMLHAFQTFGNFHNYESLNNSQRVTIVYSSISKWKSRRVTNFTSVEHITQACLASCCATPIAGLPFKLNGEWVFDGGLFDFQPIYDENTITVSPFYCTNADIRPSQYVPMWWALYPPSAESLAWLFELGYEDTLVWARKNGYTDFVAKTHKSTEEDTEWVTSLGKFLGYRAMENRILDLMFVVFVVGLWKPLAFTLLYLELCTRAILCAGKAAIFGAAGKLMITSFFCIGLASACFPWVDWHSLIYLSSGMVGASALLLALVLYAGGSESAISTASNDWRNCTQCMRNIASLSLLLRTIPIIGVAVPVKRHDFLLEHSLVYRVINHFV